MRRDYNKLVRDRIPEIIHNSGKRCAFETMPEAEYRHALLEKLLEDAQEAFQAAQRLAEERLNPELTPDHLLSALVGQDDGTIRPVLEKLGVRPDAVEGELAHVLEQLPKDGGAAAQLTLSPKLRQVGSAPITNC